MIRTPVLGLMVVAFAPTVAWGHGFNISLVTNKITALTNNTPVIFDNLFQENFSLTDPSDSNSTLLTNHGSVSGSAAGSGFMVHSTPQSGDDSFHFDVISPLLYSSGGTAVPTPAGVNLNIQKSAFSIHVSGASSFTPGFDLVGFSSHETNKFLSNWAGLEGEGVYGFAYRVSGHNAAGQPFISSDPLVVVFDTPQFSNPSLRDSAARAIYSAAVPEPSSLVLCLIGAASAAIGARRQRPRRAEALV